MKPIETIDPASFAPYGTVLEFTGADDRFEILVTEPDSPWRLAVFRSCLRSCAEMECHPASLESFEPMRGTGVLLVAAHDTPEDWHAFLLDRPVCLHKGVWHALLTLTEETVVKIAENLDVTSELRPVTPPVRIGAANNESFN